MSEELGGTVLDATDTSADDGSQDGGEQFEGESNELGETTETEGNEEGTEGEEGAETEGESEGEVEPKEELTADGRKMPDSLKKAIAALKATSPEAAKEIKGLFFSNQEYRTVFPKPADAVAAKALIDEVGGQEGIQQIQEERQEWNQIDADFAEGKKEFVTSLAEGNPEGFLKTAPHVINEFATRAPEQYAYYANNVAINTLAGAGISLDGLKQAYHAYKDKPEAQAIIAEVHNALAGLKEKATEFEQKRNSVDPEREKFKQEKTQFEQQRRADFETRVDDDAEKYLADKMKPEIDRVINGRKVDPEAMKGYQQMVQGKVMEKLAAIPGFKDKLEAFYRTGDQKKSIEYITSQYNRILPEAAKVIEPFLRNIGAGTKLITPKNGVAPTTQASAGEIVLKEMPDWDKFDQTKTTVADVMQGFGVLKNGKKARGWA